MSVDFAPATQEAETETEPVKVLLAEDEARNAIETEDMFVVQPAHSWWSKENWEQGEALPEGFRYASDTNPQWMTAEDLYALVEGCAPNLTVLPREEKIRARA